MKFTYSMMLSLLVASAALGGTAPVTLNAQGTSLAEVTRSLSEQSGAHIILDAGVTGSVTAELTDIGLEQALDMVVKSNDLKWQKLYAQPDEKGKIPIDQVKAQIDALAALQDTPIVIYDPAARKQTIFVRVEPAAAQKALDPAKLGLKEFYFIYKPKPPSQPQKRGETAMDKLADLRRQRLDTFLKMSPDERKAASQQDMLYMLSLPYQAQVDFMTGVFVVLRDMDSQMRDRFGAVVQEVGRSLRPPAGQGR